MTSSSLLLFFKKSNRTLTHALPCSPSTSIPSNISALKDVPEFSQLNIIAEGSESDVQATLKVEIPLSIPLEFPLPPDSICHPEFPHLFNGSLFGCVFYLAPVDKSQGSTYSTTFEDPIHSSTMTSTTTSAPTSESVQHPAVDTDTCSPIIGPIVHVVPTAPPALIHPVPIQDIPSITFASTPAAFANTSVAVAIVTWFPNFYPSAFLLLSVPSFSESLKTLVVVPRPVLSI
jgi:hypothetical protein